MDDNCILCGKLRRLRHRRETDGVKILAALLVGFLIIVFGIGLNPTFEMSSNKDVKVEQQIFDQDVDFSMIKPKHRLQILKTELLGYINEINETKKRIKPDD